MSTKTWASAITQIKGLKAGDPVLVDGETCTALDELRIGLLSAHHYFATLDTNGRPTRVALPGDEKGLTGKVSEFVEAALLVYHDGDVYPAKCTFKGPKVPAIRAALEEAAAIRDNPTEWASQSKDHKLALDFNNQPCYAFVTAVTITEKTNKAGSNDYHMATGKCYPTGSKEWKALADFFKHPDATEQVQKVFTGLQFRMNEVNALVKPF